MKNTEYLKDNHEEINIQEWINNLEHLVHTVENKAISMYQELLWDDFENIQNLEKKNKIITDLSINKIKEMWKKAILMKIEADEDWEIDRANFCTIRVLNSWRNDEDEKSMRNIFEKVKSKCKKIEKKNSGSVLKEYSYEKDGIIISFGETFENKWDFRDYQIHTYVNICPTQSIKVKWNKKQMKNYQMF